MNNFLYLFIALTLLFDKKEIDYFYDTYLKDLEFVETDVVHASFTFIYFSYTYQDKYVRFDPLSYNLIIAFDYN